MRESKGNITISIALLSHTCRCVPSIGGSYVILHNISFSACFLPEEREVYQESHRTFIPFIKKIHYYCASQARSKVPKKQNLVLNRVVEVQQRLVEPSSLLGT